MAKNVPNDSRIENLTNRVAEMETDLREALERTSGLTWNTRNWEAVKTTLEIQEQRFDDLQTQINSAKNLVMTLQQQFTQFQQQRATELQHFVNFGPTSTDED